MNTSNQLLEAALHAFAAEGYHGASMSDMAAQAGIQKSSIYNHYASKEELFLAVVRHVYRRYTEELETVLKTNRHRPGEQRLKAVIAWVTDFLSKDTAGQFYVHFFLFPPDQLRRRVHSEFLQFEQEGDQLLAPVFAEILRQYPGGDYSVRQLLDAFYCLLDGVSVQMFNYDTDTQTRKREAAWHLFWSAVTGSRP